MKTIGGKQFPTVWSDLSVRVESVDALDAEPSVSIVCIADWLERYHQLTPSDGNLADELYQEGIELLNYLPAVSGRVEMLHAQCKLAFETWASATKASFAGEKLSEAARERMILVEPRYTEFQNDLIRLDTFERWCNNLWFALKEGLNHLNIRMKRIISEQPPAPRSV